MKKYATEYIDEYTHFVVWYTKKGGLKIESGWHYEEDAQFQLDEIKEVLDYAKKNKDGALNINISIASRKRLHRAWKGDNIGLMDIHDDDNWASIPW